MKVIFILIIVLLLQQHYLLAQQNRQTDSLALVALYNATNGANWSNPWVLTQPIDNWLGVRLNTAGRVDEVNLRQRNLSGTIPDLNLSEIKHLYLKGNNLTGSIPDFSYMHNLTYLELERNQLSGTIPNFTKLYNIENIMLSVNQLIGNIPDFNNIPQLHQLDFSYNQLTGNIPNFSNLPKLKICDLAFNQLRGSLSSFSNTTWLLSLDLRANRLTGSLSIPASLTSLRTLDVSNNKLDGTIDGFLQNVELRYLLISYNQYTFEDLLPIIDTMITRSPFVKFFDHIYLVQDTIGVEQYQTVSMGNTYTINLNIDDTVSTNVYYWYKDNVLVDSTFGVNEYVIQNFSAADVGSYTVRIRNTLFDSVYQIKNYFLNVRATTLSLGTGIIEMTTNRLKIYPNPVQEALILDMRNMNGAIEISIIDLRGSILKEHTVRGGQISNLQVSNLPTGAYIVRGQQQNRIWREKFIKQ